MENQERDGNGNESRIYERALEISKSRLTDLTWNNILYEANLDVMKVEAEENKISDEIIQLQLHIQELANKNDELTSQKNEFQEKYLQMDVDYTRLQELDDKNEALISKINGLQSKLGAIGDEDLGEVQMKLQRIDEFENDKAVIVKSLNEANEKLTLSDKASAEMVLEIGSLKEDLNSSQQELDVLRPKIKELESIATKGQSSTDAYSELEQEFLKRDVESALVTQKKLYTELLQRSELKEEEHKLEIEKLKPTPKKRGRPRKEPVKDGGLLDSALV